MSNNEGNRFDNEADKHLWEWAQKQDQRAFDQFALGIVGIGALFFAYGSIQVHDVQILVAFIGLAGSAILWDHIYGARQEYEAAKAAVMESNPRFRTSFEKMNSWRDATWFNRWLYMPATRLMMYFMALVSAAWGSVILSLFSVSLRPWIFIFIADIVTLSVAMMVVRKLQDRKII